jgi:hypothetical protein
MNIIVTRLSHGHVLAFGAKRMANSQKAIECALKFNDEYTGSERIAQTTRLIHPPENGIGMADLAKSCQHQREFFNKLHLQVDHHPYTLEAKGRLFSNKSNTEN